MTEENITEETYINRILNHKCKKCGSKNYNHVTDSNPNEPKIKSYFQCRDCGHIEYI